MRFCMLTTFYPPANFGGDGVFVQRLARALARRGHAVEVVYEPAAYRLLTGSTPPPPVPEPGVRARPLSRKRAAGLGLLARHQLGRPVGRAREIAAILTAGSFDVVHFHNVSLLGGPGVVALGSGIKLVTLHDYWFVCNMHVLWRLGREACTRRTCLRCTLAGGRPPQLWRPTGAVAGSAGRVGAFLTGSEVSRRLHEANGFPAPIRVLPHFAPTPRLPIAGEAPHPRPYFLYTGRLERLKGIEHLVGAFRRFRDADLVVAGTGDLEAALRREHRDLPHVRFLGFLDEADLAPWYAGALAVVAPSLAYETFGLSPVEGFAHGRPAIVRAGGALEELVRDGGGLLYHDEEGLLAALSDLAGDADRRAALGAEGRRLYEERYSEAVHVERYLELVRELEARCEEEGR